MQGGYTKKKKERMNQESQMKTVETDSRTIPHMKVLVKKGNSAGEDDRQMKARCGTQKELIKYGEKDKK